MPDSPGDPITALIFGIATVLTALIGVLAAALRSHKKPKEDAKPAVAPSPLANFSGTQNEFMELVIRDNEAIRAELASVKSDGAATRAEVETLRRELSDARSDHGAFERAVRRYLGRIAAYVETLGGSMPYPDADDLGILEHTLPPSKQKP